MIYRGLLTQFFEVYTVLLTASNMHTSAHNFQILLPSKSHKKWKKCSCFCVTSTRLYTTVMPGWGCNSNKEYLGFYDELLKPTLIK